MKNSTFRGFSFVPGFLAIVFALSIIFTDSAALDLEEVMAIQDRHTPTLMAIEGVVGTGTTVLPDLPDGGLAIRIYTETQGVMRVLPESVDGVPVDFKVVGVIRAFAFTDKVRPVTAGISAGDHDAGNTGPTGTHGSVVTDGSKFFTLSNNHVYADENTENIGNELVQPGDADLPADQDPSEFVFARLSDFNVIRFNVESFINPNVIDAAIGELEVDFTCATECGYTPGTTPVPAALNLKVKKCGRTTMQTQGQVAAINVTVDVLYEHGLARFVDQIEIEPAGFAAGGDSGSLVVSDTANANGSAGGNNPVGLLFAGSDVSTIANPIEQVLDFFNVTFCGIDD
jgi:hypothetical protein